VGPRKIPNIIDFDPALPITLDHISGTGLFGYLFGSELSGIVYTCSLGFLDIGHIRDLADLTSHYFTKLKARNGKGHFDTFKHNGEVKLNGVVPETHWLRVARSLAYDESVFHEIYSYWIPNVGGENSSFSPEDCSSNFIGTFIGEQAIVGTLAGGIFDKEVTLALTAFLTAAGALPTAGTIGAFSLISGLWTKVNASVDDPTMLRRRNFGIRPITPWVLANVPSCTTSQPIPGFTTDLPPGTQSFYDVMYEVPFFTETKSISPARDKMGTTIVKLSDFPAQISKIRADAVQPSRYGPNYDKRD
jgi:Protein of unknown function (DUF4056)